MQFSDVAVRGRGRIGNAESGAMAFTSPAPGSSRDGAPRRPARTGLSSNAVRDSSPVTTRSSEVQAVGESEVIQHRARSLGWGPPLPPELAVAGSHLAEVS